MDEALDLSLEEVQACYFVPSELDKVAMVSDNNCTIGGLRGEELGSDNGEDIVEDSVVGVPGEDSNNAWVDRLDVMVDHMSCGGPFVDWLGVLFSHYLNNTVE